MMAFAKGQQWIQQCTPKNYFNLTKQPVLFYDWLKQVNTDLNKETNNALAQYDPSLSTCFHFIQQYLGSGEIKDELVHCF